MKTAFSRKISQLSHLLAFGIITMVCLAALIWMIFSEPRPGLNSITLTLLGLNFGLWSFPIIRMLWKNAFDPFHPLAYLAGFYAVPMIFLKGLALLAGRPLMYMLEIPNPVHYLNLALLCTLVGWGAVLLGFYSPFGAWVCRRFRTPRLLLRGGTVRLAAVICLMLAGFVFTLFLYQSGAFGSALSRFTGNVVLVSLLRPFSGWLIMAFFLSFLLAVQHGLTRGWVVTCLAVSSLMLIVAVMSASRAQLFIMILTAAAAVFYAKFPHIRWRAFAGWIPLAALGLILGMLFISQYRLIRTYTYGTSPVSTKENLNLFERSFDLTSDLEFHEQVEFAIDRFTERFSSLELLGLTLALAPKLEKAEQEAGIDNNILKELGYSLIPRVIWPEKPILSDFGLWFTRLYLNSSSLNWNGPSAFGDLYRNFGIVGIPVGMFIVGIYLRLLYQFFILRNLRQPICAMFYIFLLQTFNLESGYAQFITVGFRTLFSLSVFTLCLCLVDQVPGLIRKYSRGPAAVNLRG